jgi:hypothetical protein
VEASQRIKNKDWKPSYYLPLSLHELPSRILFFPPAREIIIKTIIMPMVVFGSLSYDAFSVTALYSVDERMTSG